MSQSSLNRSIKQDVYSTGISHLTIPVTDESVYDEVVNFYRTKLGFEVISLKSEKHESWLSYSVHYIEKTHADAEVGVNSIMRDVIIRSQGCGFSKNNLRNESLTPDTIVRILLYERKQVANDQIKETPREIANRIKNEQCNDRYPLFCLVNTAEKVNSENI